MRAALNLSTVLALAPFAVALQSPPPALFAGNSVSAPWIGNPTDGTSFGRAFTANVFGDGVEDALLFDGAALYILFDADHTYAPMSIATGARDACTLRGAAGVGRDALAVVDAAGLRLGAFDPQTAAIQWSTVASSLWVGAKSVRAADLDLDGREDLVGVSADGNSALIACAGTSANSFPVHTMLTAFAPLIEVVPVQWDADPELELAMHCTTGVFVVDVNGSALASFTSPQPGITLTRLSSTLQSFDRLAWIRPHASGTSQWLMTLSQFGVDGQVDLGALGVVAAVAADADADGDDDLLISHQVNYELLWLRNLRSVSQPLAESFQITLSSVRLLVAGPVDRAADDNRASPALADFDGDGDFDVVFGCEGSQTVHWIRGDWRDEERARADLFDAAYDAPTGTLTLELSRPLDGWNGADELIADVFRRDEYDDDNQSHAVSLASFSITGAATESIAVAIPETSNNFTSLYNIRIRAVRRNSAGHILHSGPARTATFALLAADVSMLAAEPDASAVLSPSIIVPEDPAYAPGLVTSSRARRFTTNEAPLAPLVEN